MIKPNKPRAKSQGLSVRQSMEGAVSRSLQIVKNPVDWVEDNFGIRLYSNQIADVNSLFGDNNGFASVAARGAGKCVDGDVMLSTGRYVHISEVKPGDSVLSLDEKTGKFVSSLVRNVLDTGVKESYELLTSRGHHIFVSGDHPFLTDDGWKNVKDLKVGGFIATARKTKNTPVKKEFDTDILTVLAYLIGDGCTGSGSDIGVRFSNVNKKILSDMDACLNRLGAHLKHTGRCDYGIRANHRASAATGNGNPICNLIKKEGLNVRSNRKFIPAWIFDLPDEGLAFFLSKLYATDGWASYSKVNDRGEIGYCSVSRRLADDVSRALHRFGVATRVNKKYPKGGQTAYQVIVHDRDYVLNFCSSIGIYAKEEAVERVRASAQKRSPTGSLDIIPHRLLEPFRKKLSCAGKFMRGGAEEKLRKSMLYPTYSGARRSKVVKVAKMFDNAELLALAESDVYWDTVKSIEKKIKRNMWDLEIEGTHNFICNDIVAHNTHGISAGLGAYCVLYPGLRVIVAGPKEKQAGRIIKEIVSLFKDKRSLVSHEIDWAASSALRLQFKNGSYIVALSGQETANVEGEHGHILVIDEAHKTPSFSITNKLMPMIGMLGFSKLVMIGVTMGKNFFYKFCTAEGALVNRCPWNKAENFQDKKDVIFYKGRPVSKALIARMPVPYKIKYFPDRPDLQKKTGQELTVSDWETQYELFWLDDLLNFLSDDDQKALSDGRHPLLTAGLPGEVYAAGLDTAQGSLTGRKGTDETALSIWRLRRDGLKEKVASYIWVGDPLAQKQEIFEIINPLTGIFKCQMTLVDYSNIGIDITNVFRAMKIPVVGKLFGSTEPTSKKNWKNALYDHFLVELQSEKLKYPDVPGLEKLKISAVGAELVQVTNCLRGFWEWCNLIRIKGRGLNDTIEAPNDNVESEDGSSDRAFDDVCSADIMGVWALDKLKDLEIEVAKGGDLSSYQIPIGIIGASSHAGAGLGALGGTTGQNPMARQGVAGLGHPGANEATGSSGIGSSWLSDVMKGLAK